jgi:D-glycero-D-manno-heptose 1,7-bisphosphate phosphatase
MLYLFDMDGTLITSFMTDPLKRYHVWETLPGRAEGIRSLLGAGDSIAIVTNQAGVAFYKNTVADAERKFREVKVAVGLPEDTPVYVCYHHPSGRGKWREAKGAARRKPSGLMITEAMRDHGVAAEDTHYVGDMEVDEQAAAAAGVKFSWADEFFA